MYIGLDALYAALCWRQPAVPSLCVIRSHSVLSLNTLNYAHIRCECEKDARIFGGADTTSQMTNLSFLKPIYPLGETLI